MNWLRWINWLLFRFDGRLARMPFILTSLALACMVALPVMLFLTVTERSQQDVLNWSIALFFVFVGVMFMLWATSVKRLHDFDFDGMWSALLIIMFVNIVVFLALCLVPGSEHRNRYGWRGHVG